MEAFFPSLLCVCECVNIHGRLVGGGLPFQENPAVDVFGICGPCSSIVRSPQWLLLSRRWALPVPRKDVCIVLLSLLSPSSLNWSVRGEE